MQYSWPYILVALILIALSILWQREQEPKRKSYYTVAAVALFVFFFCFRGFVSTDWQNYLPFYESCSFLDIQYYFEGNFDSFEPGYTLLNIICKGIWHNYHFLVFVIGVIDLILLVRFAKRRTDNIPLFLLLFIALNGITIFCNQHRNFIAILIFLNALPFLEQRRPLPYFLLCLLALTFHISAIFYFFVYFFFLRYPSKWLYLTVFLVCNAIFLLHVSLVQAFIGLIGLDEIFQEKIIAYTETYDASRVLSIGFLERTMTGILIFIFYDKLKNVRKGSGIYINAVIFYYLFVYLIAEFEELSQRLSYLFIYGYWFVWIDLIRCFAIQNNRKLYIAYVYLYCVLRMWFGCALPDYKYENILFGSSTYEERLYFHHKYGIDKEDIY